MCSEVQTEFFAFLALGCLIRVAVPTLHPLQYFDTLMLSFPPAKLAYVIILTYINIAVFVIKHWSEYNTLHDIHPRLNTLLVGHKLERHRDGVHFVQEFECVCQNHPRIVAVIVERIVRNVLVRTAECHREVRE